MSGVTVDLQLGLRGIRAGGTGEIGSGGDGLLVQVVFLELCRDGRSMVARFAPREGDDDVGLCLIGLPIRTPGIWAPLPSNSPSLPDHRDSTGLFQLCPTDVRLSRLASC